MEREKFIVSVHSLVAPVGTRDKELLGNGRDTPSSGLGSNSIKELFPDGL